MTPSYKILSILFVFNFLLSACGSPSAPAAGVAKSERQRQFSPDSSQSDMLALVDGNNDFALDLYQALRTKEGNLFYSPFSISLALGMTYAGARGKTEAQMSDVLHFDLPQERLHPAFNALDLQLTEQWKAASKDEQPLQLNIANAVWAQQDYPFLDEFLDTLALNYGAGVRLADFVNKSESVRKEINSWVSDRTNEKIKDLIPQGVLDAMTRMVLVNAIYFKADWQTQFDPNSTYKAPFTLPDGTQVQVDMMMEGMHGLPFTHGDGYQVVELPYEGGTAAMDILIPDVGNFQSFESEMDAQFLAAILNNLQPTSIELGLPKFTYTSQFSLSDPLTAMGMNTAFDPGQADFSGMTGTRDLYISEVIHKAFVAVDEDGTEAAAATAVIMELSAAPMFDVRLIIDRPFIFLIRDLPSGQILFLGRVLNPAQ